MKKFILAIGLALASFEAMSQNHVSQSFLAVRSVAVTNTSNVSNLAAGATYNAVWTNTPLSVFTNLAGVRIIPTNGPGSLTNFNILRDCSLWVDRSGQPVSATYQALLTTNSSSGVSVYVRGVHNSGTVGTLTFTFRPLFDGTNMETGTTKDFTFVYTPVASSVVALSTNVPTYLWPGAKAIRLLSIVNSSANANADCNLLNVSLNGFVP